MLDVETKKIIDNARNILVGKLPAPNTQVEQITLAMLYKFMDDIDQESIEMGGLANYFSGAYEQYSWREIMKKSVSAQQRMNLYTEALEKFYVHPSLPKTFKEIFKNATVPYRDPEVLSLFLKEIDHLSYVDSEILGDGYEYLLSILGSQGELGQFRTPRNIIDFIVSVVKPNKTDTILDPACGTGGFLISAYKYILSSNNNMGYDEKNAVLSNLVGYDIEPSMVRISDMNMYLHGCTSPNIIEYDTLTFDERWEEKYDVILANPPFFTPKGGITPHNKFSISSKKAEVLFSEYIMSHIARSGKGAFIVPEGIIANNQSAYVQLRKMMIENGLYAVVGLHRYVFKPYSGVSTLILFFDKRYRNRGEVYLRMIEEDGFEKGEGRLSTPDKNDLPECKIELEQFKKYLSGDLTKEELSVSGTIVDSDVYDENYDFHPYSYYVPDLVPAKEIGKIFNIQKGTVQSSKREEGEYTFITASDTWLTHNEYTHDCEALIFVFGAGGSLGKVHYINGKFVTSDLCFVLTPKDSKRTNLKYYYAYFTANRKDIVKRLARGTNKKAINDTRLKSYSIFYPDKAEQDRVGNEVQKMFDRVEELKQQIEHEYQKLETLI